MPISRYRNSNIISGSYFETISEPEIDLSKIPTINIRVSNYDRLDVLAAKFLGSGEYWWIIAMINDISWAFSFEEGQILKIPQDVNDFLKNF